MVAMKKENLLHMIFGLFVGLITAFGIVIVFYKC